MASYIYLSSDTQLLPSNIVYDCIDINQAAVYRLPNSTKTFFFEDKSDLEIQSSFSYSKHFSEATYQVASVNRYLPVEYSNNLNQQNEKALHELFNYIIDHFENTQATYVEILFCSYGSEDAPLFQEKLITYEWLSIDDLYYSEQKFIRIDTQKTEFFFRKRSA